MSHFGQSHRCAQIVILKILNVYLRLKFSPALTLTKLKRFETGSHRSISETSTEYFFAWNSGGTKPEVRILLPAPADRQC